MPSPIGHGLAGISIAWLIAPRAGRSLVITAAVLAAAPDVDVVSNSHRGPTHSVGAVMVVTAVAAGVAALRSAPVGRVAAACGSAYSSHLLLDWLGRDTAPPFGMQIFWPFARSFYGPGADVFLEISRRYWRPEEFVFGNLRSLTGELVVLVPMTLIAWWWKKTQRATSNE